MTYLYIPSISSIDQIAALSCLQPAASQPQPPVAVASTPALAVATAAESAAPQPPSTFPTATIA